MWKERSRWVREYEYRVVLVGVGMLPVRLVKSQLLASPQYVFGLAKRPRKAEMIVWEKHCYRHRLSHPEEGAMGEKSSQHKHLKKHTHVR
jgi:hypothetical protein